VQALPPTMANVPRTRFDLRLRSQRFLSFHGRSRRDVPGICPTTTRPRPGARGLSQRTWSADPLDAIWRHTGRCRSLAQVSNSSRVVRRLISAHAVAALWCCTFSGGSNQRPLICRCDCAVETKRPPCDQCSWACRSSQPTGELAGFDGSKPRSGACPSRSMSFVRSRPTQRRPAATRAQSRHLRTAR
jgi:hypothetical protein